MLATVWIRYLRVHVVEAAVLEASPESVVGAKGERVAEKDPLNTAWRREWKIRIQTLGACDVTCRVALT
jgi:hypothetical protein